MLKLCEFLEIEEGREFKIDGYVGVYRIMNNNLEMFFAHDTWSRNLAIDINDLANNGIYDFQSKKKQFTDDELAIMRSLPIEIKWIARDITEEIFGYEEKPSKHNGIWYRPNNGGYRILSVFSHIFKAITTEDEEPLFIDDYVER